MIAAIVATRASGGEFRHSIERMEPAQYLSSGYYEHWLTGAATMAFEHGLVARDDLGDGFPLSRPARPSCIGPSGAPAFSVGARVRVRAWHPTGHTRCPRYVQGRVGTVVRVDGTSNVPDVEAHSPERIAEPTYSVRFDPAELWGEGAEPGATSFHVDLWHRYLEEAP
jgi:nitrile hydratase